MITHCGVLFFIIIRKAVTGWSQLFYLFLKVVRLAQRNIQCRTGDSAENALDGVHRDIGGSGNSEAHEHRFIQHIAADHDGAADKAGNERIGKLVLDKPAADEPAG